MTVSLVLVSLYDGLFSVDFGLWLVVCYYVISLMYFLG